MNKIIKECIKDNIELQKSVKEDDKDCQIEVEKYGISYVLDNFTNLVTRVDKQLNSIVEKLNKIID